jgi:hypothetical protein
MKKCSSIDTDDILYKFLAQAKAEGLIEINGIICPEDDRPADSQTEDITFKTIAITEDKPQDATANINIYVPDVKVKIRGTEQTMQNRLRLQEIGDQVKAFLRELNPDDLEMWIESDTLLSETAARQHYRNLRIKFNIH